MILKKKIIIIGFLQIIFLFMYSGICQGRNRDIVNKKILIVCSYSHENTWENNIINGFRDSIDPDNTIKLEFLDSRSANPESYRESFINLLDIKYSNSDFDFIITLDDEAFQLIRANLFNEESFVYKKKIIFAGVNNYISLSKEESEYVTGILEYQDNLLMINTILTAGNKIDNIYVLLDKSIYSNTIKNNIEEISSLIESPCRINILEGIYFDDVIEAVSSIKNKNSAIYICGVYKDKENEEIAPKVIIPRIKEITNVPIYSKLDEYIEAGAIGGIVNDGYKLGKILVGMVHNIIEGNNIYNVAHNYNTFTTSLFNYKAIREYNINPLKLPDNSIFINKKFYNLLLPKWVILLIWGLIVFFILGIILLIYLYKLNKKEAKDKNLLLIESMERERIKTDFFVTVSHELRTPLNIIINASNLLKIKLDNDNIEKEFFYEKLEFIMKNSNRLRRYINNLIDVSKLELGYMNAEFTNENIVSVVEDVTSAVVDLARNFNIEIIFDTEEEEIVTAIDTIKIERVILNILSNAIKFTKDGGKILVNIKRVENNVIIEIIDNGIGMPDETRKHIFEKFKRADINEGLIRQHEGSGLGLFIVKGIVSLHKGNIRVESEVNKGTTFIITLPISSVESENKENMLNGTSLEYLFQMEFSDIDKKE